LHTLAQDLRYALRAFAKNPGFTVAALLSLAIGIGANTSIFSVANALLLRPLPYKDAARLVILWNRSPGLGIAQDWFSPAQFCDIRNASRTFEQVAIAIGATYNITGDGEPERVGAILVSSNLLPMLGATSGQGRLFVAEEDSPGRPPAVILTHGMWVRRYGSDPQLIGKSLIVDGRPHRVIGIMPPSFSLPHEVLPTLYGAEQADILLPRPLDSNASQIRTHEDYNIVARLRPGVSPRQAQSEMDTLTARLRRDFPDVYPPNGALTFGVVPLLDDVVGDVRPAVFILWGSVGFVLLIACANVANLLLSRAVARQKEIGVRTALGASRTRIVRQLLSESILLGVCGGALGILFSLWSVNWIHALGTKSIPRLHDVGVDARVLLFTLLLSFVSGILFGLAPALRVARVDLNTTLKDASRGSAGTSSLWGRGNNARRLLVIAELALSVVLLIGAGLLIRSFSRIQNVAPGFDPKGVLTFDLALTGRKYSDRPTILNNYRQLWERLSKLPGVTEVGGISALPLSDTLSWTPITIEGRQPPPGEKFINADARHVAANYFQTMKIPLRRGRFFNEHDVPENPRIVIVDEHFAQQYWPNEDPIGKRIHIVQMPAANPWQTIVGVVGRVKHESLDSDPRIVFYLSHTQSARRAMTVAVRSRTDPASLTSSIKHEMRALDPDLPIYGVRTMEDRTADSLARRRFSELLLAIFSGLALVLAAIGIYGVMAYMVSQGTRELGIRIALGATQRGILALVVRQGMTLAFSGVAIGLIAAFALTRLMSSLLFGVGATDALTFSAIAALLTLVALVASAIPARRASRIDPMVSLRAD
jgi:predicted permease